MLSHNRPVLSNLLCLGILVSLWLLPMGPPRVLAQEADADVPIVQVGGTVHGDLFTGQATLSVPLTVLPGRQGLQPELALVYGSANGNGWVGMGWKLEKGVIERNLKFGVDYEADDYVFRLDGVNVELVNIGNDEYRAKIEGGFTRIQKKTGAEGPYFEATDRYGTRYIFGERARVADPDDTTRVFRWCLERVEDPNGNYMTFTYETPDGDNQAYLTTIAYTGHEGEGLAPATTVAFELEDRPDAPTLYTSHFPMRTSKRLTKIVMNAPNGEAMRSYQLAYHTTLSSSGRSLLQSVKECGRPRDNGDGTVTETCLPAQTFTYTTPQGVSFSEYLQSLPLEGTSCSTGSGCRGRTDVPQGPVGPSDIDGNGRLELVALSHLPKTGEEPPPDPDPQGQTPDAHTNCVVSASIPGFTHGSLCTWFYDSHTNYGLELPEERTNHWAPFNQLEVTAPVRGTPDHRLAEGPTGFADITGNGATEVYQWDFDGMIDLHIPQLAADQRVLESWVSLPDVLTWDSFSETTDPQELNFRIGFADIDGDGQADFWGRKGLTVEVHLASEYDAANQEQTFEPAKTFTWAEMGPLGSPMGFVDVNGDGEADFWGWRADGDVEIRLSQGDGTVGSPVILPWVNDSNRERPLGFADINGDGLADFWGWAVVTDGPYVTGHLYYAMAQGDGSFGSPQSLFWADPPPESSPPDPETDLSLLGRIGFADVNGDGKADVYGWKPDVPGITVHLTQKDGTISATGETVGWTGNAGNDGPFGFADMTGDGLADFYGWTASGWGGQVNILRAGGEKPDLLVGVENGLGGTWTLTYVSTADSAHAAEQTQFPFALPIVQEVLVDDGYSNLSRTTYGVTGGYYHLGERDFRGFHRAEMRDPRGITTRTWFHQGNDVAVDVNDPTVADGYLKGARYRETVTGPDPNNQGGFGEGVEIVYAKTETIYADDTDSHAPFFTPPQTQTQWRCGEAGPCQVSQIDWVYDAYGNPLQEAHHGDVAVSGDERTVSRSFSPNISDWLVAYPDREIRYAGVGPGTRVAQTDFFYDGGSGAPTQGNLTSEIRWHDQGADVMTQWTYDAYGNRLTRREAATGATTTWTYDASQTFVVTETNALSHPPIRTAYYGVDGEAIDTGLFGQLKRVTDANGAVTKTAYDRLGRVTRVTHPDGLFTDTAYQYFGQGVGTQRVQTYWEHTNAPNDQVYPNSPYGELASQWFDGLGRVIKDQQPGTELNYERTTDFTYDARGLLVTQSLPHFAVPPPFGEAFITYTYEALGRVKTVSYPDGRVEHTCYEGGATATVDANGHKRRTVRDPYGQVVTVQEYDGEVTSCSAGAGSSATTTAYAYDALGNLTTVTDAQGNITAMDYDSLSRKIQMDDPDMGIWTYAYDAGVNLIRQTDAKGQVLHFQYDLLHRRVQKDFDTAKALGSGDVQWSYDGANPNGMGRLTKVEHPTASFPSATEYGYDGRGRVTSKTETIGAQTFTFLQTYDGLDRETSMTYPDGSVVEKDYYGAYLSQVRELGGEPYATVAVSPNPLGYTELGQPKNLATGNGVTTAYAYEDFNYRLTTLKTTRCDGTICVPGVLDPTTLQEFTYGYDPGGNVTSILDPQHSHQSFGYDARDRLTQATVGEVTRTYTYDAIGNMLSNSQVGTYTYPPSGPSSVRPHAVTTAGPYTYTYDANGNLTTGANRTIEYDHDNRPITITSTGYGGPPVAPTITTPPTDQTVAVGGSATFTVVATGTAPVSYQWRRDGVDIPGAIATSYRLASTTLNDSGTVLTVEVANPAGHVTSAGATLTVVPTYPLTVTMEGTGSGTVTSNPSRLSCSSTCSESFTHGTAVTLTAAPQPGMTFRGWNGGGCSGTGNCVVTMDQAYNVTATFGRFLASWPLEGNASDASGQGQDGVLIGTPLTVTGQHGQALEFDGNQEYVSLPTGSLTANQSEVTLAMWVKPEAWGNMMVLYAEDLREGSFPFETFNGQFAIRPSGWVTRDTTTGTTGTPNNTLTLPDLSGALGAWHHLIFVYSVSAQRKAIYLDGTLVNATSVSIDPLTGSRNDAALGSSSSVGAFWGGDGSTRYQGALDEVRLFDYALTDAEIADLAGSPPPSATPPSITAQPQNVTVTEPNGATFTVTASGTAPLSYQWQRNGATIAGATSAGYTLSPTAPADSGATFAVVVSNSAGNVTSASATLTVQPAASPPTITAQPQNVTVTEPAGATFTVTASGTAPLSYQWRRNGATIAGATSASYTLSPTAPADSGATFAVVVSNSAGNVTSASATLTVQARPAGPFYQANGGDGLVSLEAEHYQTHTPNGGNQWTTLAFGGASGGEGVEATPDIGTLRREIGEVSQSPRLDYRVHFVTTGTHYVWVRGAGPNHTGDSLHIGLDGVAFTTSDKLSNFGTSWTWSRQTMEGSSTEGPVATIDIPTVGEHTLNLWMREDGVQVDKLVLTTSTGYTPTGTGPAESGDTPPTATPPSITAQPQNVTVTEPNAATFTVTASGTAPLSYQWRRNGATIAGATSASYTLSPTALADSGATFAVVVSNSAGNVTSANATLTVQPAASPPTITTQPQNVTVTEPAGATFTVTASGTAPLSYQWRRNGANIAGATSASYTLSPTASADSGATFAVVVSNSAGNVTSASATLTVQPAVNPGPFTLTVGVSGIGTVTSTPSGIDCGYSTSACTTDYAGGTTVTLTANPFTLYQLSSWGGACSGSATTCVVTMNQAQTVTATFAFSFGALEEPGRGGGTYLVSGDSGASEEGSGELAHQFASRPSLASAGLRPWDFPPPSHGSRSPYLHLAAFRAPGSQLPTALQQVTEEQDAAQHQLDEVLVRTQAAPPDGTVTTFVYNGDGQRIIKQVEDWVTVYLGQNYVCHGTEHAVRNGGDLACAKLVYANGQRVAMVQVDTGKTTYFHSDHLGSTSVVTDDTGAVEQELAYWAFGETRVNSSSQNVDIAYKYTGQEEDRTTGLYDYHARLYDPLIGRFTQPDTIVPQPFNPQSLNRYSYVLNNPLKYTDPTGYTQTLATVNVFAAHEPAPSYTYSGGTLPHSGPTYNDYNPTGPASMNLVSGGTTNWPTTTPTSGGGRKGNSGRSQQGLDISAQGQDFNFLHLISDLKQPAPQIHGPGPAAGNAPGILNDLYRSILKLKRGRNVEQAFEALALQVPNGQKTFGTVIIHPDRVQVFDAFLGKGPYLSNPDLGFVPIIRPITGTNPLLPGAKDPPYPPGLGPKLPLFNPPLESYEELR